MLSKTNKVLGLPKKRSFSFLHVALYTVFFLSGGVGLAYEIVWARQLSLLFGVSIYAVSAVLVAFLGGLGLGAEFFGRKLDKGYQPLLLYAFLEIGLGVYILLFPFWIMSLEKIYIFLHPGTEGISFYVLFLRLVLAIFILIIPAALMGGTLPALVRYFADHEEAAGRLTGKLYALNTLGAMIGCIVTGFWMVEHLGLTNTLRVGASINLGGLYGFKLNRPEEAREMLHRALRLEIDENERKSIKDLLKTLKEKSDGMFNPGVKGMYGLKA